MSDGNSQPETQIEKRFGILPNFFRLTPEDPEITANLWGFALFAYFDNPLPSLFKERLFVYVSRFCRVRYCIARHVGFLAGLGHAGGDAKVQVQSPSEIVRMLVQPFPQGEELAPLIRIWDATEKPLKEMPDADSELEGAIFAFAGHVFLQTADAPASLERLRTGLGALGFQRLVLLLSFVRTAHYWTEVHPHIALEKDIKGLLKTEEALAECVLREPDICVGDLSLRLVKELPTLRRLAIQATSLLATVVDSSADAIISMNLDGTITSWNIAAQRLFGYSAQEAIGQSIMLIVPAGRRDEEAQAVDRILQHHRVDTFESMRVRSDGSEFDVAITLSPMVDEDDRIVGISHIARDITEQKRAGSAVRESEARLRILSERLESEVLARTSELEDRNLRVLRQAEQLHDLSGQLLRARDEERRHVARELHDSTGQLLGLLNMKLASLARRESEANGSTKQTLQECSSLASELTTQIRTLSYLLHPPLLDDLGLASALKWFVDGFNERSNILATLDVPERFA